MLKCGNCNEKIKKGLSFCPNCGKEITAESVQVEKNVFLTVVKAIGKGIWLVICCIGYLIATIFAFNLIMDFFEGKDKK